MKWALIASLTAFLSTCGMMLPVPAATPGQATFSVGETISQVKATVVEHHLNIFKLNQAETFVVMGEAHLTHLDAVYLIDNGHQFMLILFIDNQVIGTAQVTLGQLKYISWTAQSWLT